MHTDSGKHVRHTWVKAIALWCSAEYLRNERTLCYVCIMWHAWFEAMASIALFSIDGKNAHSIKSAIVVADVLANALSSSTVVRLFDATTRTFAHSLQSSNRLHKGTHSMQTHKKQIACTSISREKKSTPLQCTHKRHAHVQSIYTNQRSMQTHKLSALTHKF